MCMCLVVPRWLVSFNDIDDKSSPGSEDDPKESLRPNHDVEAVTRSDARDGALDMQKSG